MSKLLSLLYKQIKNKVEKYPHCDIQVATYNP